MGTLYFWLRSPLGLALIIALSILPTFLIAQWLELPNEWAIVFAFIIVGSRHLAWRRWGNGSS